MIDFHNHVLPGLDDGSKSIAESLSMLHTAINQGITDVVCTVHFQHPKFARNDIDYKTAEKSLNILQTEIGSNIKLHLGAEVFYLPNLLDLISNKLTTFEHGKYMLIEFYPFQLPQNIQETFYRLKLHGTTPIIAHPERNRIFQNNIKILEELVHLGCLIQLDAGSILGHFGKSSKHTAFDLLKHKLVHIIGSDAHNDKKRNFCLFPAIEKIKSKFEGDIESLVNVNPRKVLNGESISPIEFNNSKSKENIITRVLNSLK